MRHHFTVAVTAALSLAACGSADEAETGAAGGEGLSDAEIAERAEDAVTLEPGQYRSTVEMVSVDIPGAPPEAVAMMKRAISSGNTTTEYCLTPEEAEKGYEEMARNSAQGDCNVRRFDVDGGDIDAEMTCTAADGTEARMTLDGTGSRTSSDMTMTIETDVPGLGEGTMTMRAQHERIGDC